MTEKPPPSNLKDFMKETLDNNTNCAACRLISSTVMVIGGLYLYQQRNNFGKANKYVQSFFAGALGFLGFARALALPPFTRSSLWETKGTYGDLKETEGENK